MLLCRQIKFVLRLLLASTLGCSTPPKANSKSWNHTAVFIDSTRIEDLKKRIAARAEPNYSAWLQVKQACDEGLTQAPNAVKKWAIPGFYDGHDSHEQAVEGLHKDSKLTYEEALCFRITNDPKYAKQSIKILNAWATTLKETDSSLVDTKLSINEFFSPMIVAADLLDSSSDWSLEEKTRFKDFIREIILPLNTMEPKKNNHANWGVLLVLSIAAYTDDLALFEKAETRFKELMDLQIGADGTMVLEYDRSDTKDWHGGPSKGKNGIWYSHYSLMPMTLGAEVLRINGRNLFDYKTNSGTSIQLAFNKIAHWSRHPEKFPFFKLNKGELKGTKAISYFEILNQHWPNPDAASLLKNLRPLSSTAGIPDLTLTHGGF